MFFALRLIGEMRIELEQMQSLIEAAMAEAEQARSLDSPERQRAMNIGRVLHDVMCANARYLGEIELHLTRNAAAAAAGAG
jgi:hypothetical protein